MFPRRLRLLTPLLCLATAACPGQDPSPVDSGPSVQDADESPFDGGTPDAGDIDAGGIDAGDIDAGDIDAGDIDAGDIDAGDVDAGDIDAGDVDAGDVDAGSVDVAFCDDTLDVNFGTLCAVRPSRTDPLVLDTVDGTSAPSAGFGFHVVGFPSAPVVRGVWVHFSGSYGKPYSVLQDDYATREWLNELMEQGFVVVQPAYANSGSVNGDICGTSNGGNEVDNCAGLVRQEILEGVDVSEQIAVDLPNGVYGRLDRLITFVQGEGFSFPSSFQAGAIDWAAVSVSGHSQGAGHAYFMAKTVGVAAACFLGGPYDRADTVNMTFPLIADWYKVPGTATPVTNMGAFVVIGDDNYDEFVRAYEIIGLTEGVDWFDIDGVFENAHGASVGDPTLKSFRARACFEAAANFDE